jgi:hypothetical protein
MPQRLPHRNSDARREDIRRIFTEVASRLRFRLRDFRLHCRDDGLTLTGVAPSWYAKQLAQQAVMQACDIPIARNAIEVETIVAGEPAQSDE